MYTSSSIIPLTILRCIRAHQSFYSLYFDVYELINHSTHYIYFDVYELINHSTHYTSMYTSSSIILLTILRCIRAHQSFYSLYFDVYELINHSTHHTSRSKLSQHSVYLTRQESASTPCLCSTQRLTSGGTLLHSKGGSVTISIDNSIKQIHYFLIYKLMKVETNISKGKVIQSSRDLSSLS